MEIKDSVHDHIEVRGVARDLLDTPPVQRLRHVRQLGTVTLVYPSANHTRFEHSLGVYHLADEALAHLNVEGQQAERVRAAALLHDVGHAPFSHNVESVVHRHTGKWHDDVHELLDSGAVAQVLADHGLNPDAVADLVAGDGKLGQLVSGELDVDRMDYLVRDAHHTGVPYGTIDHERLVRELAFVDGELVLAAGNVQTAESLLVARALMTPTVYGHHTARISKSMLRRGAERLLEATDTTAETMRRMDDHDLLVGLRQCEATAETARRLTERDLLKRAVWAEMGDVPEELLDRDHAGMVEAEREIAADAEVDPADVILDVPGRPEIKESTSRVMVNGEVRPLGDQSTLVGALRAVQRDQWRLGVYAPEDVTQRVGHAASRVLGLDIDGSLVSDARPGVHTTLDDFQEGRE
ncbi:HD domain-containing protein [Halorientalis pallida]|uniref:HD domain-containing protein n=1 Tax=Halorientalis pallida TaxID=2479928 RepID=A0A498KYS6_9EURY|nr:HD domain-containing protein [Halorientalis pallida]RXK51188.1 HD domain-containing protein [Halorientalis pallida]